MAKTAAVVCVVALVAAMVLTGPRTADPEHRSADARPTLVAAGLDRVRVLLRDAGSRFAARLLRLAVRVAFVLSALVAGAAVRLPHCRRERSVNGAVLRWDAAALRAPPVAA